MGDTTVAWFAMDDHTRFMLHEVAPAVREPERGKRIPDVVEMGIDHIALHYSTGFHDCTIRALHETGRTPLEDSHVVTDRKTLRKLVMNGCVSLPTDPFYCKRELMTVMAENVDGVVFLGGTNRYDPAPGSFGRGFEQIATGHTASKTFYRIEWMHFDDVSTFIRCETDGVDAAGVAVELRCKKYNPRYPPNRDYYLNSWIQMVLSNTMTEIIGFHQNGRLSHTERLTLSQVQARAGVTDEDAARCMKRLGKYLARIRDGVPPGRQATITVAEDGHVVVRVLENKPHPMFSSDTLRGLVNSYFDDSNETDEAAAPAAAVGAVPAKAIATPVAVASTATSKVADHEMDELASVFVRAAKTGDL